MPIALTSPHPHLPPSSLGVLSTWQRTTRDHPLLNEGANTPLPQEVEVAIIGSGICGAVIAQELLQADNRPNTIAVLEAREICSGATGRNAGHCRPDPHRGFPKFAAVHGAAESRRICESESLNLERVNGYVRSNGIECEWNYRPTHDVCLSDDYERYSEAALEGVRKAGSNPDVTVVHGQEAQKITRAKKAQAAFSWTAATLNPAMLTLAIHADNATHDGYTLHAHTPVHSVTRPAIEESGWLVNTTRGTVLARRVVFATNAYTQALVPEIKDLIVPMRAQAVKLSPPPAGEDRFAALVPSLSMRYGLHHSFSIGTRPDSSIVLGTSRSKSSMPLAVHQSITNTVDDSVPSDHITQTAVKIVATNFPEGGWNAPEDGKDQGAGVEYAWAGIIGMTPDAVPFIGPIPGKDGQFIAAGFNGHGMARVHICAPALAKYMLTGDWDPTMPESFKITQGRLDRLRTGLDEVDKPKMAMANQDVAPALAEALAKVSL